MDFLRTCSHSIHEFDARLRAILLDDEFGFFDGTGVAIVEARGSVEQRVNAALRLARAAG